MSNSHLPFDLLIPLLNKYPREMRTYILTKFCVLKFRAALSIIATCPLINGLKIWDAIDTNAYYLAIESNEVLTYASIWWNLKIITLSEGRQKKIYCMILFILIV